MNKNLNMIAVAGIIYACFAVYLYQPYFQNFDRWQWLLVANACVGALGCYVLSQRWISSFFGSFFAGAIYGFGPFNLGLAKFHPTAGFLAATVPWLFCPAALAGKSRCRWLQVPLSTLPFFVIILFFQLSIHWRRFAIPAQAKLHLTDLWSLLSPLVMAERGLTLVGFYHIPIAALIMGVSMLVAARRLGIMIIFAIGTILAFCKPIFGVSPIIWFSIATLCGSVLVGAGMQGLTSAGFADRKWILPIAITMGTSAIVTLLLATKYFQSFLGLGADVARLFTFEAEMYILGTFAVAAIFFLTRAELRLATLRIILLCSAMAIDIFFGARFIVDKIL